MSSKVGLKPVFVTIEKNFVRYLRRANAEYFSKAILRLAENVADVI